MIRYAPSRKFRKAGAAAPLKRLVKSETGSPRKVAIIAASNVGWCGLVKIAFDPMYESDLTAIAGSSLRVDFRECH